MSFQHTIERTWKSGGNEVKQTVNVTGDGESNLSLTIPDSTTDQLANIVIDASELKSIFISSDQEVTIETNDGSTPDDTFTITPNEPLVWTENCGHSNPITADVDGIYVTNASGSSATVNVRVLQDATP